MKLMTIFWNDNTRSKYYVKSVKRGAENSTIIEFTDGKIENLPSNDIDRISVEEVEE